jgi:recombination protein RecT
MSRPVEMGREEVLAHRDMNSSNSRSDSPWKKWERSMWLKCAVHELEKWVPSSTEYRREITRSAAPAPQLVTSAPLPIPPGHVGRQADAIEGEVAEEWPAVADVPDAER